MRRTIEAKLIKFDTDTFLFSVRLYCGHKISVRVGRHKDNDGRERRRICRVCGDATTFRMHTTQFGYVSHFTMETRNDDPAVTSNEDQA